MSIAYAYRLTFQLLDETHASQSLPGSAAGALGDYHWLDSGREPNSLPEATCEAEGEQRSHSYLPAELAHFVKLSLVAREVSCG